MLTAKIFTWGTSQAVLLPASFRFDVDEVAARRDPETGDVVLAANRGTWTTWAGLADDIRRLGELEDVNFERHQPGQRERDPSS